MGTQEHNSYGATLIISDIRRAISSSRPCATCWYRIAIAGIVCPNRRISSAMVAPLCSAVTAPVCLKSWKRRSSRRAALRARSPVPLKGSAAPDLLTLGGRKEQGVFAQPNMILNVVLDGGHEVRRDRDIANASIGLRSANGRLAVDPRHTVRQQGSSRRADDQPPH